MGKVAISEITGVLMFNLFMIMICFGIAERAKELVTKFISSCNQNPLPFPLQFQAVFLLLPVSSLRDYLFKTSLVSSQFICNSSF